MPPAVIALAIALAALAAFAVPLCSRATSIEVTVNGTAYTLHGAKTLQTAIDASGLPVNPGDVISLRGNVLKKSEGQPFSATVNGEPTVDGNLALKDGDIVEVTDGKDVVEAYDAVEEPIPYGVRIVGTGAVYTFSDGADGVRETRTGHLSGEVVERQAADPVPLTCSAGVPDVGDDKVVALTFDRGPSDRYTGEIIDILSANDAKATFFCVGTSMEGREELVRRAVEGGNQICTNTYDYARPSGGLVQYLTADQLVSEIEEGYRSVEDAAGYKPSRYVRLPGGYLDADVVRIIEPHVDAVIGWDIDTADWMEIGEDPVFEALMSAEPGDVVLCHDGGGDRSQTVAALRRAIPLLKRQGYTFVTIDELMEYPRS